MNMSESEVEQRIAEEAKAKIKKDYSKKVVAKRAELKKEKQELEQAYTEYITYCEQ